MDSSLSYEDLQIEDEELLFASFDPSEYELPDTQEQVAELIKKTTQKLEKCEKCYLELCTKLELLRARSESLSAIILDSK